MDHSLGNGCGPQGCGGGPSSRGCGTASCNGGGKTCGCGAGGDIAAKLLDEANAAKRCLMEDKIKAKLEAKVGKKLDKMADLAVEMLLDEWEGMKGKLDGKKQMMEKMKGVMGA